MENNGAIIGSNHIADSRRHIILTRNTLHNRTGRTQFISLEALRVVASFMIIIFHAHSISYKHALVEHIDYFKAPIFWYSCIELFFVMSGFLMIHMSRSLYGSLGGVRNFALRRLTRTPPLYWIYTLIIACIFFLYPNLSSEGPISFGQLAGSLAFFPMVRHPVIAIGWTLEYEVFFYLIIGFSIFLNYKIAWKCVMVFLIFCVLLGHIFNLKTQPWFTWTDPTLLDFAIGMAVAVSYHAGYTLTRTGRIIFLVLGALLVCSLHRLVNGDFLRVATMGIGVGLIVASLTLVDTQWVLGKFRPVLRDLSNQTYTMYLAHIMILKLYEMAYYKLFSGFLANICYVLSGFVIVVVISRPLYLIVEKPLTEALRKWLASMQAPRSFA